MRCNEALPALHPAASNEAVAAALAVNVPLFGLGPLAFFAIVHVTAGGAVLVPVLAVVPAPLNPSGTAWCMVDSRFSLGDHPVLPVPMVAAVLVVAMPGGQRYDCPTVPIVVMAILRADMRDSTGVRDMPGPVAVMIVVERAVADPAACENDRGRQQRQHEAESRSHRVVSQSELAVCCGGAQELDPPGEGS